MCQIYHMGSRWQVFDNLRKRAGKFVVNPRLFLTLNFSGNLSHEGATRPSTFFFHEGSLLLQHLNIPQ